MSKPANNVTDHALVRYLERVKGFRFERERQAIRDVCKGIQNGTVKAHGCLFEITDGRVITIAPDNGPCRTKREAIVSASRS